MHRALSLYENTFEMNNKPMHKYVKEKHPFEVPLTITEDETWDFAIKMYQDIVVETGNTLTINCEVLMPVDGRIIVKPGAKLIVDGGKISSAHSSPWQGIEVWGNSSVAQLPNANGYYPQGYLELKNQALIENAILAVALWRPWYFDQTGGIIQANDATFSNNAQSIFAIYYHNINPWNPNHELDYYGRFKDCIFELTSDYNGEEIFLNHIELNQVKGFKFEGCDFSLDQNAPNVHPGKMGIKSANSGFSVSAYCTSQVIPCPQYDVCTFNGFYRAIYADNSLSNIYTFSVRNAEFDNNACGVYVNMVNNFVVTHSTFNIGDNVVDQAECEGKGMLASGFGINANNSTGFAIEENQFSKTLGLPGTYTGIRINETEDVDEVYLNTFNGLTYGNYTEGKNWRLNTIYKGLAFYCNQNLNNYADFFVEKIPRMQAGIQSKQGDITHAAGNTFSSAATWHYYNNGDHIVEYYYCNSCPDVEDPSGSNYDKLYRVFDAGINIQNSCLSHYGGSIIEGDGRGLVLSPQEILETEQLFVSSHNDYNNVKALYDNLRDGGNTEALVSEVETAWPSDMWELREELLGKSPHLSKEVLMAAADKTDVLPGAVLFEILAANPDELKKEDLLSYLEDKANPLPDYMIDILRQVAAGITYKTVLEQQMAAHSQLKARAAHDIIRSMLNDTVTNLAQLRNWLDNLGGKKADEQIIASYMQEANFADALALAALMPQLYNYGVQELSEHSHYIEVLNFQIQLRQEGRNLFELDSTEVNNLANMAENSHSTPGRMAKGILESYYDYHYCDCLNSADSSGFKSGSTNMPGALSQMFAGTIEAVPNPAQSFTAFDYTLPNGDTEGTIKVSDVNGNIVKTFSINRSQGQTIWDTRNIQPGIYFYTLMVNSFTKSGKLIISK